MFGEFTASLIEQSSSKFVSSSIVCTTEKNRFLYPNYLSPINFDCKTHPENTDWNISQQDLNYLNTLYQDKWICLPTHWYSKNIAQTNIPCQGIAMFSNSPAVTRLAYSLFWIKSHIHATTAWPSRAKQLQSMINANHPYSAELIKLQDAEQYRNWKFLAYKFNMLKDGKLDLLHYMYQYFFAYHRHNRMLCTSSSHWFKFDVGNAYHGSGTNLSLLEDQFDLVLDRQQISVYSEKNLEVLKEKLGFTIDTISSQTWLNTLSEFCVEEMTTNNIL